MCQVRLAHRDRQDQKVRKVQSGRKGLQDRRGSKVTSARLARQAHLASSVRPVRQVRWESQAHRELLATSDRKVSPALMEMLDRKVHKVHKASAVKPARTDRRDRRARRAPTVSMVSPANLVRKDQLGLRVLTARKATLELKVQSDQRENPDHMDLTVRKDHSGLRARRALQVRRAILDQ